MVRITDLQVLRILKGNARTSYVNIAKELGVTETAIRKRVRNMEKKGIIQQYTVEADTRKVGLEINALIGIDTSPEHYVDIIEQVKENSEVISMYSSRGDHMIIVECWFEKSQQMRDFVSMLEALTGVTKVCPAIKSEKIK